MLPSGVSSTTGFSKLGWNRLKAEFKIFGFLVTFSTLTLFARLNGSFGTCLSELLLRIFTDSILIFCLGGEGGVGGSSKNGGGAIKLTSGTSSSVSL